MPAMPLLLARSAGRGPVGAPASGRDFPNGIGQSVLARGYQEAGRVGEQIGALAARLYDANQRARVDNAAAEAARQAALQVEAITTGNDDFNAWEGEWQRASETIREDQAKDLAEPYRKLYEQQWSEIEFRAGAKLRAIQRERSYADTSGLGDDTLAKLADQEAQATSPAEAAAIRAKAEELMARNQALGIWDQDAINKRTEAYHAAVMGAAVAKGLHSDPRGLLSALETHAGPFQDAHEEDRQRWIGMAKHAIAAEEAGAANAETAERARIRFDNYMADREDRDMARAAIREASKLAIEGKLTPDALGKLAPAMWSQPGAFKEFARIAANGGRFTPGPPDPVYYTEMTRRLAMDPQEAAHEIIDPFKAGNQYEELTRWQADILRGQPPLADAWWRRVSDRMTRTFKVDWWFDVDAELQTEFRLMADEARQSFFQDKKRLPNDIEAEQLLDGVNRRFVDKYGGTVVQSGRGSINPPEPIPEDQRQRVIESLRQRGAVVSEENIRSLWEASKAAGAFGE